MNNNNLKESINIKETIAPYLKYWYIYIICISIGLLSIKIYSRYIIPEYNTSSIILIKNSSPRTGGLSAIEEVNGIRSNGIDDELLILRSKKILEDVVKNLNLYFSLKKKGKIINSEIYNNNFPLNLKLQLNSDSSTFSKNFILNYDASNFYIRFSEKEKVQKYKYGEPIRFDFGDIIITKKNKNLKKDTNIYINVSDIKTVANNLKREISVDSYKDYDNAIIIKMINSQKEKAKDIINNLITVYNKEAIEDKNIEARKTDEFINERIKVINEELTDVEKNLVDYVKKNNVIRPISEAQENLSGIKEINKQYIELNAKEELTKTYKNQIEKSSTNEFLPNNLISSNENLTGYISEYNKLVLEKRNQKNIGTDKNPVIKLKNEQLITLKKVINNSINKEIGFIQKQKSILQNEINTHKNSFKELPEKEMGIKALTRQQDIKQELYMILLRKREENAISLAISANKAKIIDFPESVGPINKNLDTHYLVAALIGLLLPIGIIYLSTLLDTKIYSRKDLSNIIEDFPILGEIPYLKKETPHKIVSNDLSILSEAFRAIRTNLQFVLGKTKEETGKVILVTSTIKGEGKTFVSINLAHIFSQLDKTKTIIIGADIRNPQIQRYFKDTRKNIGLTEYLYDDSIQLNDIITTSPIDEKTSIIFSGSIPPNPAELIMNERFGLLINELKNKFNYIIIDTAPLLLVPDTFHISEYANTNIIIVRSGFTDKQLLEYPIKATKEGKLKHPVFVLNDIKASSKGYGYKYGYNYGYGYGYHNEKEKTNFIKRILNFIKSGK